MDPLKEKIHSVVNFSPAERRGLLVLIVFIFFMSMLPTWYSRFFAKNYTLEIQEVKSRMNPKEAESHEFSNSNPVAINAFEFDPNLIDEKSLLSLGFPNYLAKRLVKYRKAGGRFNKKADLLSLYGMDSSLYLNLEAYIRIEPKETYRKIEGVKKEKWINIDLNSCDSLDLQNLKGIGQTYSKRIIKYRKSLGGFRSIDQLKEVYGINDSLFESLAPHVSIVNKEEIKRINVNLIEFDDLRKHPYFRDYNLCRAIINYRKQHQSFKSINDLQSIHIINDSVFDKIVPYLTLENEN